MPCLCLAFRTHILHEETYSLAFVCSLLKIKYSVLLQAIKRKELKVVRDGRALKVTKEELVRYGKLKNV